MEIIIDDNVKQYLRTLGKNTITIYTEIVGSCWSPRPEIFVRTREPEAPEDYKFYDEDNIKIFLFKEAKAGDRIIIKMSDYASDLPNKEITVEGIDLSR